MSRKIDFACLNCNETLPPELGPTVSCPICGSRRFTLRLESESDSLEALVLRLNAALDEKDFSAAKRVLVEFGSYDVSVQTKARELVNVGERDFISEATGYFNDACQNEDVVAAGAMLVAWEAKGIETTRYAAQLKSLEERIALRECQALPIVSNVVAIQSDANVAKIDISWDPVLSNPDDVYRVLRILGGGRVDCDDAACTIIYEGVESRTVDQTPPLGVHISYRVVSCHKGYENEKTAAMSAPVICVLPPSDFRVLRYEGLCACGCVVLEWSVPEYSRFVHLSVELRRIKDDVEIETDVTACCGRYVDEDVVVGKTYRYELTLTVSGRRLDPVVREVMVRELPELSPVRNLQVFRSRGGMVQLTWEWPADVDEVELGAAGNSPSELRRLTKTDYEQRGAFLSVASNVQIVAVRSVRRFGSKVHSGPEVSVLIPESMGCIHWRICQQPTESFFGRLRHRQYGVSVDRGDVNGEIVVTVVNLTYGNATFEVALPADRREVFVPFPQEFAHGDKISVKVPAGLGVVCDSFRDIP